MFNNAITWRIVGLLTSGPAFPGEPSGPLGPKEPYKEKNLYCTISDIIVFLELYGMESFSNDYYRH